MKYRAGKFSGMQPVGGGSDSGFTIAELLAVILIMVIMMGMAVSSFYGMGRGSRMRGAVASFNTVLSLSRQYAITRSTPMDVLLTNTTENIHAYQILRHDDGVPFRPLQFLPPSMKFDSVKEDMPNGASLTDLANGYVLTYMPDGSLRDIDGALVIEISDEADVAPVSFRINGLTGLIQISGD